MREEIFLDLLIEQPIILELSLQNPLQILPNIIQVKGEKGDGEKTIDIALIVETIGQTQFNIFGTSNNHRLLIDGVEQYDYEIQLIGQNWKMVWSGGVQLAPSDKIIFRKITNA